MFSLRFLPVDAEPFAAEAAELGACPRQQCVEEATAGIRRRPGEAVQVDVCAALHVAPDDGILIRHGEHARQRLAIEHAEQVAGVDLGEDRGS